MIRDLYLPERLNGSELDEYLGKGWYRLGQIIFTTDYIPHNSYWYQVFWLRYRLDTIYFGKKQLKLLTDNERFEIQVKTLNISEEIEDLFQKYKSGIDFEISPTVKNYLFDTGIFEPPIQNVFQSEIIEIRDQDRLIAAGIFDIGKKSIAGIMNFYDPAYKKYSLGKYLMLLKINHAKQTGKSWYYPGYIAYGYPKFDYKLFPDPNAAEIFDPESQRWLPWSESLLSILAKGTAF